MKIETLTLHKCQLGEGPVWDAKRNEISWIDITKGEILQFSFSNNNLKIFELNEKIGCISICNNGDYIFAAKSGIGFIERETGKIIYKLNPENNLPKNRFNDGKCDPKGRFWVGTMSLDETPNAGSVYVFENNKIEKKMGNVTISNGMAWSLDYKIMYYIDTPTCEVVAYDFEKDSGKISDKKPIIKIPKKDGYPDGMTIDNEGMLWIAHWDGGKISRYNPHTGKKLLEIKLPASRITSCTFGGENFGDLFITSAREGLSEMQLKKQPLAGALFVIRNCGFRGIAAFEFVK